MYTEKYTNPCVQLNEQSLKPASKTRTSPAPRKSSHDPYQSLAPPPPRGITILTFITIDYFCLLLKFI